MAELETYSLGHAMGIHGLTATERPLAERYVRALVATAYEGASRSELEAVWETVRDEPWAFAPPPVSDPYWQFSRRIATYNPLDFWRRLATPALLLYGEDDERVPARRSAARIAETYKGPRLDVIFFPLADHNYRLRQDAEGKFAWPRTAPGFPDRMIEWVLEVAKP
jgi:pimeloyl-ACP methyl ester carboxylesterase